MAAPGQRFASLSSADIDELIFNKDAKNTRCMIQKSVKLLNTYCKEKGIALAEDLPNAELDDLLGKFYAETRKRNGDFYAKKSLQSTRYGLQRHFDSTRGVDILHDSAFKHSNVVYKSMLVKLKDIGKGTVKHKKVIHPDDLLTIMRSSALDQSTPRGLQNKVFIEYMLFFANRGRENLREMTKMDLEVKKDPKGAKYVELVVDKLTKTERGEGDGEGQGGVMYETPENPAQCPVASFERYIAALHPDCSAFWQRPKPKAVGTTWYDNSPVGKNTLYSKTKDICIEAGVSRKYTNHCLRATTVTALDDAGYQARDIMTVSGHRSEASIRSYSRTSEKRKKEMSAALSNLMPSTSSADAQENQPPTVGLGLPVQNLDLAASQRPTMATLQNQLPTVGLGLPVQNLDLVVSQRPPMLAQPQPQPNQPQIDPTFNLDFDLSDSYLLTSSQEDMVLKELNNSPVFGRDINLALGLRHSATSVRNTNTFNFYNCSVQLHQ